MQRQGVPFMLQAEAELQFIAAGGEIPAPKAIYQGSRTRRSAGAPASSRSAGRSRARAESSDEDDWDAEIAAEGRKRQEEEALRAAEQRQAGAAASSRSVGAPASRRAAGRSAVRGKSRARGLSSDENWTEPALRKQVAEQRGGAVASSAADAPVPPGSVGRSAARRKSRARTADLPLCGPPHDLSPARGAAASSRSVGRGKSRARGLSGDNDWVDPQLRMRAAPGASQQRGQAGALRKQVAEQPVGAALCSAAAGGPASSRAAGRSVGRPKSLGRMVDLPLLGPPRDLPPAQVAGSSAAASSRSVSVSSGDFSVLAARPLPVPAEKTKKRTPTTNVPVQPAVLQTAPANASPGGEEGLVAMLDSPDPEQPGRKKGTETKSLPNQSLRPPPKKKKFENDADDEDDELPPPKRARTAAPKNKGRKNGGDPYASSSPRSNPKGQVRSGNQVLVPDGLNLFSLVITSSSALQFRTVRYCRAEEFVVQRREHVFAQIGYLTCEAWYFRCGHQHISGVDTNINMLVSPPEVSILRTDS